MRARIALVPIALVAAAGLLAGCATKSDTASPTPSASSVKPTDNGISALSADEILTKTKAALKKAGAYHIKGESVQDGGKVTVDLSANGNNAKMSSTIDGQTFDVIKVGQDLYVKLPETFANLVLESVPAAQKAIASALLKSKYIKTTVTDSQFKDYATSLDMDDIFKPESGTFTKGETGTTNGVPTIALVDGKGNKLIIATTGEPVPVQMVTSGGQALQVTEVGTASEIKAPSADQVFDIKSILGK